MLANEDDIRGVDEEKAKWVEEEHSPRRDYYKAKEMQEFPVQTDLCLLAQSILSKKLY